MRKFALVFALIGLVTQSGSATAIAAGFHKVANFNIQCAPAPTTHLQQSQYCGVFTLPGAPLARDPYAYNTNQGSNVFSIYGTVPDGRWSAKSLTPDQCVYPAPFEISNLTQNHLKYFFFDSRNEGMCEIEVTFDPDSYLEPNEVLKVQFPIATSRLQDSSEFKIQGLEKQADVQPGEQFQLPLASYSNAITKYSLVSVAPTYWVNKTPDICSLDSKNLVTAIKDGKCVMVVHWPKFAFGGHVYWNYGYEVPFTIKTILSAEQIANNKRIAAAAAAQRKIDLKQCPASKQAKLKSAYEPYKSASEVTHQVFTKYDWITMQLRLGYISRSSDIAVDSNSFTLISKFYPSLATFARKMDGYYYMSADLYEYATSGALQTAVKDRDYFLGLATKAYKAASPSCQRLVGTPD